MGLSLAIIFGFLALVGINHQEVLAQQKIAAAEVKKMKTKRKAVAPKPVKKKQALVLLDGIEVRNLKG